MVKNIIIKILQYDITMIGNDHLASQFSSSLTNFLTSGEKNMQVRASHYHRTTVLNNGVMNLDVNIYPYHQIALIIYIFFLSILLF